MGTEDVHKSRTDRVKMPIRHPHEEVKWIDRSICLCVYMHIHMKERPGLKNHLGHPKYGVWRHKTGWRDCRSEKVPSVFLLWHSNIKKSQRWMCTKRLSRKANDVKTNKPNKDSIAQEIEQA